MVLSFFFSSSLCFSIWSFSVSICCLSIVVWSLWVPMFMVCSSSSILVFLASAASSIFVALAFWRSSSSEASCCNFFYIYAVPSDLFVDICDTFLAVIFAPSYPLDYIGWE